MKNFKFGILIVSSIIVFLIGCAKKDSGSTSESTTDTTSTYTRSQTPTKTSVAVPASLAGSGSSSSRTANAENCDGCDSALLYSQLKAVIELMKHSVSSADLNLMVADIKMADGDVSADQCYEKGQWSVTFTQEMYNALVKMEKEFGGEEGAANSNSASFKSSIGQSINPPIAFKYSTTSEGGYAHELKVSESCSNISSGTDTETFRWDSDKTKLLSQFEDTQGSTSFKGSLAFDDTTDKSVVNMTFSSGSESIKMTVNLAECTDAQKTGMTGDCAVFSLTESMTMSSFGTIMIKGVGKADDNGGFGEGGMSGTMDIDSDGDNDNFSMQYREAWDSGGNLTYLAMCPEKFVWNDSVVSYDCSQASNWQKQGGTADTTYQEDSYSAQSYTVNGVSSLTAGSYHLVISGKNPNTYPETIVGYGEIRGADSFWDFWGADSSGSFDVWGIGSSSMTDNGTDATVTAN